MIVRPFGPRGYVFLFDALQIFFFGFTTGLSGAVMPGPLLAFTVDQAARKGYRVGFLVAVGHGIIESTLVAAIFIGAANFLTNLTVLRLIAGLGATVMGAMGVMMLRDVPKISLAAVLKNEAPKSKVDNAVAGGFLMTVLNPTFPVWWATGGLILVAKFGTTVPNVTVFYAGHIMADVVWYATVSSLVGFGRHGISDRMYRMFIGACAVFLVGFATYFAYCGITGEHLRTSQTGPAARVETSVEPPAGSP